MKNRLRSDADAEWHGKRLYFSGDTESNASLLAAKRLDVAFISPWMFRSVLDRLASVDAKQIVIYHHETGETIAECRDRCVVPRQGDTLGIE